MINKEDANILIVDDIEDNRYTLERRLKRDGYTNIFLAKYDNDGVWQWTNTISGGSKQYPLGIATAIDGNSIYDYNSFRNNLSLFKK